MIRYFIVPTRSPTVHIDPTHTRSKLQARLSIPKGKGSSTTMPIGDVAGIQLLIRATDDGESSGYILPAEFNLAHLRGANDYTVDRTSLYGRRVPLDEARRILGRGLSNDADEITEGEYKQIVALMESPIMSETSLLAHVREYINARGYYFDDETVANYHICLKTRPFVILAGLSGTGKSKLSQLYAEALGHTTRGGRYLRVAVRPSWNDDRYLLGYLNTLTGDYIAEPALDFIVHAEEDRENLYFFCLDEMNLAHVEHYFSQFLSALEEEETADRRIPLYSTSLAEALIRDGRHITHRREVLVPPNLLFTGTVNVDETTQPISDKVIDRANTLEFFEVDLDKVPVRRPAPEVTPISATVWESYRAAAPDTSRRPQVVEIGKILNKAGMGLGYRVLREIEMYMANSAGLLEPDVAFDLQVKQRILPRLRGTLTLSDTLRDLTAYMKQHHLPRSAARLEEMEARLTRDGYTSFWR